MNSEKSHLQSIALTATVGIVGVLFAMQRKIISKLTLIYLSFAWLGFSGILYFANSERLSLYTYFLANIIVCLFLVGVKPPNYKLGYKLLAKLSLMVFVIVGLLFVIGFNFPVIQYLSALDSSFYEIKNRHVDLVFSNRLALTATAFSIVYFVTTAVRIVILDKSNS